MFGPVLSALQYLNNVVLLYHKRAIATKSLPLPYNLETELFLFTTNCNSTVLNNNRTALFETLPAR